MPVYSAGQLAGPALFADAFAVGLAARADRRVSGMSDNRRASGRLARERLHAVCVMTHAALRITLQSRCCGTTTVAATGASAHAAAKREGRRSACRPHLLQTGRRFTDQPNIRIRPSSVVRKPDGGNTIGSSAGAGFLT